MPPKTIQRILAIDLGKFKSVACEYDPANSEHHFTPNTPALSASSPRRSPSGAGRRVKQGLGNRQ